MSKTVNIQKTSGGSVTVALPKREPHYPFKIIREPPEEFEPYDPPRPEPTYTFWRHSNDTFPLGQVVYFVYCGGRIKIGVTDGLVKRLSQFTTSSPYRPVAILLVKGGVEQEREFHQRFAEDRIHREWFRLSKTMRNFFRARLCAVGRASLKQAESEFRREIASD